MVGHAQYPTGSGGAGRRELGWQPEWGPGPHPKQVPDSWVLPHGEGQGEGIECYILSFPGFAGTRLGCVLAPEVVESLDLPVIPAADSVVPPVSGVLGPTSSEAAAGGDTPAEVQPFLFSQGFPPVPAKLAGKILRLEFVDMAELLQDNIEVERRRGSQGESSSGSKHTSREIPDIFGWLQCFGIYISVMASKFPERVPNMLAYQTTGGSAVRGQWVDGI